MSRIALAALAALALALASIAACGPGNPGGPGFDRTDELTPLESADIIGRSDSVSRAVVKHVLIGWSDLEGNYGGRMSDEAKKRSRADAERLVRELAAELDKGAPIEPLMIEHSDDRGTKQGQALSVEPGSNFVPKFKSLSLRLKVGEHGVVKTSFGYHIIKRVK